MDMNKDTAQNSTDNTAQTDTTAQTDDTAAKKLRRPRDNRMLAGVCAGAAEFLGIDVNIVRIGLVVFNLFGGAGVGLYLIGWALIPEEGAATSIAEDFMKNVSESPSVKDAVKKTKESLKKERAGA
ncbi:PspC domain-containing protein [Spirillospora sp. NPDC127506]|jgi:phage shock protein PspC (stress-responsive transcriptional regulator)